MAVRRRPGHVIPCIFHLIVGMAGTLLLLLALHHFFKG